MNRTLVSLTAVSLLVVLGGCASGTGGKDYSREQARTVQEVQMGVVESVREVNIEGTKSPVGAGAGAVVGGVAGSTLGGGRGQIVGAAVGAVLDAGRLIAITQSADEAFNVGDRVRVLTGGGVTRVSH